MRRRYLICYDITNEKILGKVHRYLKKRLIPIQYSVFMGTLSYDEKEHIKEDLADIINTDKDDVRIYSIPDDIEIETMGVADSLPEDIHLFLQTDSGIRKI